MAHDEQVIAKVWEETARVVSDRDPNVWRKDECGAWINRGHYENEHSEFGWRIQQITPDRDDPEALRALHCRNGMDVAAGQPHCRVRAAPEGLANVDA
jgi:hypothetical protein